ncbi:MAG: NAD(P)/FAD-dependent oxidoreductase [Lautropia sp.]|nr:NAD(P)/FAD-dependent oxidoreductase [Lautropia sp.]
MNPSIIDTDAVVIGLGPVGLYQVFQLGLAGLKVQGIDSLPAAGGQCRMLYPDKAVYDIPGFRRITGAGLAAALLAQLLPFQHGLHYDQTVNELARLADGRIHIRTASGMRWRAGIVVLALGAGAWHHRPLDLPGAGRHRGRQLFEQPVPADDMAGRQVVVLGGGNEALQQCLDLIRVGARVALVHKRARFSHYATDPALVRAIDEQQAVGHLQRVTGQPLRLVEDAEPDGRLRALVVADADDGHEITLPLDVLLLCHGLGPTLAPLADCGVPMEKRYIPVDPATCATSVPGILAVGDVCTYPGKLKLIGAGFHEAMLAARTAAAHLLPRRPPLEYTAISLRLQRRLGVLTEEALAARLRPHIQFPDGL